MNRRFDISPSVRDAINRRSRCVTSDFPLNNNNSLNIYYDHIIWSPSEEEIVLL